MTLALINGLKRLELRHNRVHGFMGSFNPLESPSEVKEALPDCTILVCFDSTWQAYWTACQIVDGSFVVAGNTVDS